MTEASGRKGARDLWVVLLAGFGLAMAVAALYWPATGFDYFVIDDRAYTVDNPLLQGQPSLARVGYAFCSPWQSYWIPLTWLSFLADSAWFGRAPGVFHRTNVVLFALNALLFYGALVLATGARWKSLAAAALFALHPLRVESVAWIAERKDVLSGVFFFGALLGYALYARTGRGRWYGATVGALVAGLLAKPSLVVLPLLLLLLDYWPLRRARPAENAAQHWAGLCVEKVPLVLVVLVFSVLTLSTQTLGTLDAVSIGERWAGLASAYTHYLEKTVWPTGLMVRYAVFPQRAAGAGAVGAGVLLAAVSWAAWRRRNTTPFACVGWFWYLVALLPVCGLVRPGKELVADRFSYLPSVGLALVAAWGSAELLERWVLPRGRPVAAVALGVVAAAVLATATRAQLGHWRDTYAVCARLEGLEDGEAFAHYLAGVAHLGDGRADEGVRHLERFVRLAPRYADGFGALGAALAAAGRLPEARSRLEQAIALDPAQSRYHGKLAEVWSGLGRPDEAVAAREAALARRSRDPDGHYRLAEAYASVGRTLDAVHELETALRLRADFPDAHYRLAELWLQLGQPARAERHARAELERDPAYGPALRRLGGLLAARGAWDEGALVLREALRTAPNAEESSQVRRELQALALSRSLSEGAPAGAVRRGASGARR